MTEQFWQFDVGNLLTILTVVLMSWKIVADIASIRTKVDTLWSVFIKDRVE